MGGRRHRPAGRGGPGGPSGPRRLATPGPGGSSPGPRSPRPQPRRTAAVRAVRLAAMPLPVAVLGAGSFGTCLAVQAARECDVAIWARDPGLAAAIQRERRNPRYLSEVELPPGIRATANLEEALAGSELVICAIPSHGVREVMSRVGKAMDPGAILVSTVKGIEEETGMLMHQVLEDVLPPALHPRLTVLSGPSFAHEVAIHLPTAVTLACRQETFAISVQTAISSPWFRCYTHDDVIGVEVGGALKNVIAIAVGMCDGLSLGLNARAAVMTRGLREITRLGEKLGANPVTFQGLSGMGDLLLTCTGDLSRNRRVGLELGHGRRLREIVSGMDQVAEGVRTTYAVCELATRHQVEMPICFAVRSVLEGAAPEAAVHHVMSRQLRSEME